MPESVTTKRLLVVQDNGDGPVNVIIDNVIGYKEQPVSFLDKLCVFRKSMDDTKVYEREPSVWFLVNLLIEKERENAGI